MSRIFFEVSDLRRFLAAHGHPTGIQRVILMLLHHTAARLGRDRLHLAFLDYGTGGYHSLPLTELDSDPTDTEALAQALCPAVPPGVRRPTLEKYLDRPLRYRYHTALREVNAALGRNSHFTRRGSSIAAWRASAGASRGAWRRRGAPARPPRAARFRELFATARPGDTLVVLDAAWGDRRMAELHRRAHAAGLRVLLLVHDLCPLLTPEFFPAARAARFETWLRGSTRYTARYLANSQATAADLRTYLQQLGEDRPVDVMPLAQSRLALPGGGPPPRGESERPLDTASRGQLSDAVASLATRPFVLCVGTLEVRKNLWALAQVWDRLRRDPELDLPRLVFAGRPGWMNEDFERLMDATGQLGGWARILHGPTDAELDHLYRRCLFTACVSFREGWGLPIGESLSYGKTAVVSRSSSMPEVGGDLVEYCDPESLASIEAACRRLIGQDARRAALEARIAGARLRGWADVAEDLLSAIASAEGAAS